MDIIGGKSPTGEMPEDVGQGIFGFDPLNQGVFGASSYRPLDTPGGIFFNPNARTWYEAMEPDTKWVVERRPGRPLYPGSYAHGLVLVGPSMGDEAMPAPDRAKSFLMLAGVGVIVGAMAAAIFSRR